LNPSQLFVDADNPGTNWWPSKTFGLGSKELYDCVGDRMEFYLNLYAYNPKGVMAAVEDGECLPDSLSDYESTYECALAEKVKGERKFWTQRYLSFQKYGITREVCGKAHNELKYDTKATKKIIRRLSKDCKTRREN